MAESSSTSPKQKPTRRNSSEDSRPYMLSSSSALNEELQCSICLDVFTDPVTTPCGHNFCKTCLNECWKNTQNCSCPLCKETFSKRPDLKINTTLRELVQHFEKKFNQGKSEVLCDICDERKQKAVKSCLTCQSSYCETHLEPHRRVPRLKKHKLMDAVENLEDYICQKHERPLELFCRDDQTCVCDFCSATDHKTHNTVPIEDESAEKKNQLVKTQTDVQQMIQNRMKKIQDIQHSVEMRKRCQTEVVEMLEEKQKAAEKQAEDLIKELEQEITELKRRNSELEQISHTEDHLHLLQINPSLYSPKNSKNWTEISIDTHVSVDTLNTALTRLKDTLHETVDQKLGQTVLRRMQQYAVDVTLDPDTAHPYLILSDDGKQVTCGDIKRNLPDKPERFDRYTMVLGKKGFSSGRFYFEVQVKGKTEWDLGVVRESINRKGSITLTPVNGFWTVGLRNENEYKAGERTWISLCLRVKPQKVGVFVDYEEGLVSFYDVESSSHIYSFTGQSFTQTLFPYFSPCLNKKGKNSTPLIITPVSYN
ncbi:E3 ubiquitin-protein ligase TRIM39-like isoform X5 [Xyrauchen texanus]|uniref:E3 ubiquitin-protein ligase TRIM39-like isoform X5 n=1 Tax=Xyrauchen texanus TaxID=154827 RepID=UPI0022420FF9|nr:E3 ubiquitin-protein ligase TRIM39-like isoform X5 [Xyrauchen texanus]